MTLQKILDEYGHRLSNGLHTLPSWKQTLCVFAFLACSGVIGGYVWQMPVGIFFQSILILVMAWLFLGKWKFGLLSFVIATGCIWILIADSRLGAALVVIAAVLLILGFTIIPQIGNQTTNSDLSKNSG